MFFIICVFIDSRACGMVSSMQDRREGGGVARVVTRGPVRNKVCIFYFIAVFFRGRFQARAH